MLVFIMEEKIDYFDSEGKQNTMKVIELVKERLNRLNDIKYVVVASASGESALLVSDALKDMDVTIINVTHHAGFSGPNTLDISDEMLDKLEENGIYTFVGSHALSGVGRGITNKFGGINPSDIIAETLRMFSHGIKVCAEISIMVSDAGLVPVGEEIIAIGGRKQGFDSACVLTPANMTNVFDIRFHEIIAMPRP